jgi:hypothetical protein
MYGDFLATKKLLTMKKRIVAAIIYAITGLSLYAFLDFVYGMGPVTLRRNLVHSLIVGAVLFGVASLLSFFTRTGATACALAATLLSWPFLSLQFRTVPWGDLTWSLRHRPESVAAVLALIIRVPIR